MKLHNSYVYFLPIIQSFHPTSIVRNNIVISSLNNNNLSALHGNKLNVINLKKSTILGMQKVSSSSTTFNRPKSLVLDAAKTEIHDEETKRCIEVEAKFSVSEMDLNALESKLANLGFVKNGQDVEFVDWYFDLPEPNWVLSVSDNWLRYRELLIKLPAKNDNDDTFNGDKQKKKGIWQLKCGRIMPNNNEELAMTVYEELEGDEAIDAAISMLPKIESSKQNNILKKKSMDGYMIPSLPNAEACDLVPFARFKTTRSSWILINCNNDDINRGQSALQVDIDCTDFGYSVGEVEQVVDNEDNVYAAKKYIEKTIEQITGVSSTGDKTSSILGKLELYMIQNRKNHFDECVKRGSMKIKQVT